MSKNYYADEIKFVVTVAQACYSNDKSCVHILARKGTGKLYVQIPVIAANKTPKKVDDLIICRIDGETIEELHNEAGKEYWSMDWLEYVIKQKVKGEYYMSLARFKRRVKQIYIF